MSKGALRVIFKLGSEMSAGGKGGNGENHDVADTQGSGAVAESVPSDIVAG